MSPLLSRTPKHARTEAEMFFADQRRVPFWGAILASIGMLNTTSLFLTLCAQY